MTVRDLEAQATRKNREAAKARKTLRAAKKAERPDRVEHRRAVPAAKGQREPRERDNTYLQFIRRQPCASCGATRRIHAAHVRSGYPESGWRPTGMQEKPSDHRVLPLCADCHVDGPDAQHKSNERKWWAARGIYPPVLCAGLRDEYETERKAA